MTKTGHLDWAPGLSRLERSVVLGEDLLRFQSATGVAPTLGEGEQALPVHEDQQKTSTDAYLSALGYPEEDMRRLERFQQDAGLTVDGWLGPRTWDALLQLVTFEEPVRWDEWSLWGSARRAIVRATQLRLQVLGVRAAPPDGGSYRDDLALVVAQLGELGVQFDGPTAEHELLEFLFDPERMVFALKHRLADLRSVSRGGRQLLGRVVWIELFLAGVEVGKPFDADRLNTRFWRAARKLRKQLTPSVAGRGGRWRWLDAILLERLHRLATPEREVSDQELLELLVDDDLGAEARVAYAELTNTTKHRFALWDGLRRAAAWLGRAVHRVAESVRNLLSSAVQLAKVIFARAKATLDRVQRSAEAVVAYVRGGWHSPTSSLSTAVDFDVVSRLEPSVATAHVERFAALQQGLQDALGVLNHVLTFISLLAGNPLTWWDVLRRWVHKLWPVLVPPIPSHA